MNEKRAAMKTVQITINLIKLLAIVFFSSGPLVRAEDMKDKVSWPDFLSRSDLIWTEMPTGWSDAAFIGNGIIGTIFWQQDNSLYFEISRTDAYDHRNGTSIYTSRYRMPNGNFTLDYKANSTDGSMRLDLWNAEARGHVNTGAGKIMFRALTHAIKEVILLEVTVEGDEQLDLNWHPDICQTSRKGNIGQKDTMPYPPQTQQTIDGVTVSIQSMPENEAYNTQGRGVGQYATGWKVVKSNNGKYYIYISEVYSYPGTTAAQQAADNVNNAARTDITDFINTHRTWWHKYYQKSFLSIPNSRLESFYWIQMYKMASATQADRPMMDLAGPWYMRGTQWPGIWWNLNTQCAYSPFNVSNHNDLAGSLINWMWKYKDNLEDNANGNSRYAIGRSSPITLERKCNTSGYEVGDLGYALHNVWRQYRCTMDDDLLRDKLYPLMRGHFRFYMDYYVEKRDEGKYHLKPSSSPEYTRQGYPAPKDCNYNLAIFKWLTSAMVYANDRLKLNDSIIPEVKDVLANLADYPVDPNEGFMVGEGQKFAYSHRHWSHLFMIYPFYEYTYDDPQQGALIDKSLKHWLSYSEAYRGYSWLAAASMTAMKGDGDTAVEYIFKSLDHERYPALPNTLYLESSPVIETPLLAARSIQDLILTSYHDVIRVFPAAPSAWSNMAFHNLRTDGAFLVSAKRQDGVTQFVRLESLAGEPCKVKTGINSPVKTYGNRTFNVTDLGNGIVRIDLKKNEWAILYTGSLPDLEIAQVPVIDHTNYWGTISTNRKQYDESNP
jgi:alpha-L-fucosidase 2